jgi:putative serine/threonine protein kinase
VAYPNPFRIKLRGDGGIIKAIIILHFALLVEEREVKNQVSVMTDKLWVEPYASVLCYPRATKVELSNRLEELRSLGVKALEFSGKSSAFDVPVLGKGYVGVVVVAHLEDQSAALKIRRVDADRADLNIEAQMLIKANAVNVGPKFFEVTKDFMLMQLIDGELLPRWLDINKNKQVVRSVLVDVLEQCFRLDAICLDHGELSKAPKHVIVDRALKPCIVDFETSSVRRKPANVTAICQYLFSSRGAIATVVAQTLGERYTDNVIDVLRAYKKSQTRNNFEQVLQTCLA